MHSNDIHCTFCGKSRLAVDQMVQGPTFKGETIYICNECVEVTHEILRTEKVEEKVVKKKKEKILTPHEIKNHLDQYIIGQDDAKIAISVAVYNHYKRINNTSKVEIDKSNLLMVGESGCGKTLTVKTIAKLFDIPYVIGDATSLTEAGYVGEDVENLIKRLIQNADGDIERASRGIVFIDEIDKKSKKSDSSTSRDVSGEGVQQALLKMIEGTIVQLEDEDGEITIFDTSNVLFICSGAFVGLDEIIKKNRSKSTIGIGALLTAKDSFSNVVKDVRPEDFVKFGLIPEFVGRCPVTVVFEDLTSQMLVRILKEPTNSIVSQFQALFKFEGVSLEFDDKYLLGVAEECIQHKIGARGLRALLEKKLQNLQFNLPKLAKDGVNKIHIDAAGTIKYIYKTMKRANNE